MAELEQQQKKNESLEQSPDVTETSDQSSEKTLSKNQLKKQRKYETKMKFRLEKRQAERQRKKERRKLAIESGVVLPPCRKRLRKEVREPINVTIVIDCSFEEHMVENDIRKLVKQIQHCYAINRRSAEPFKCVVSSYGGTTENIIENLEGSHAWDIKWSKQSYEEMFSKENIIYLAAESENILDSVEEDKVYVIGGLVDHNSKKGLCYKLAQEKGISHAQLPISSYLDMKCRKVLTIDHVFEILQKYHEQKDWESAFFSVIPKRKGAQIKTNSIDIERRDSDDVEESSTTENSVIIDENSSSQQPT